jgi:hypothetical protein
MRRRLVPVTVLTIATLGVILAGITTSTEAAAMGAAGAILLVLAYGRFTWKGCSRLPARSPRPAWCCSSPSPPTCSAPCSRASAPRPGSPTRCSPCRCRRGARCRCCCSHLPARLAVRVAGDRAHLPADARAGGDGLGYDMVWFGTIVAVVLQTAFLSPPVAMSAYYLKQVVKDWSLATSTAAWRTSW